MIRHRFLLKQIARECASILNNSLLSECFTQEKHVLMMCFLCKNEEKWLEISLDQEYGTCCLRNDFRRAKKNVLNFFSELVGQRLISAEMHPDDRMVLLHFSEFRLLAIYSGSSESNIILFSNTGEYISAFKSSRIKNIVSLQDYWGKTLSTPNLFSAEWDEQTVQDTIKKTFPYLGKYYTAELMFRMGFKGSELWGNVSLANRTNVMSEIMKIASDCDSSRRYYLCKHQSLGVLLSLIPLQGYTAEQSIENSPSAAVRKTLSIRRSILLHTDLKKKILLQYQAEKRRLERTLEHIEKEMADSDKTNRFRRMAELLMGLSNPKNKMGNSVELQDWEGNKIIVPLDEKKTIIENAEHYFLKSRKNALSNVKNNRRLLEIKEALNAIETKIGLINNVYELSELRRMTDGKAQGAADKKLESRRTAFKEFPLETGYTLYVGRNAANNDELTLRFAKPNDLWFHARGASGSHAVLRTNGKEKTPKYVIEQAAEIAAYYSSARNAGLIPVAYTEKKYVRKPKGSNPGSVTLERENVVMVRPKQPKDVDGDE